MIQSMTGYGKFVVTYNDKKINIEVKSLNSKNLDLSTRVAPLYREKEMEIRQIISKTLVRGKVDFTLTVDKDVATDSPSVNQAVVEKYYCQLKEVSARLGLAEPTDWLSVITRMPDVMSRADTEVLSDEEWAAVRAGVERALDEVVDFRCQEGAALQVKFTEKLDNIASLLASIDGYEKSRVEKIRSRMEENLGSIPGVEYDKNRLEQELIYYIEKLDISEEKQRLANHLAYFSETMAGEPGQGKKLGFIAQEMGREINTTGSKSNLAEMQNIVVMMKDELEQIKEQVLNVL